LAPSLARAPTASAVQAGSLQPPTMAGPTTGRFVSCIARNCKSSGLVSANVRDCTVVRLRNAWQERNEQHYRYAMRLRSNPETRIRESGNVFG